MRKIAIFIAIAVSGCSASVPEKDCAGLGEMAYSIMETRQNGIPESAILYEIKSKTQNDEFQALTLDIIEEAYNYAREPAFGEFSGPLHPRDQAAEDYKNTIESWCDNKENIYSKD